MDPSPPSLLGQFQASYRPCLKKQGEKRLRNDDPGCPLVPQLGTHGHRHTHKCLQEAGLGLLLATLPSFQTVPELGGPPATRDAKASSLCSYFIKNCPPGSWSLLLSLDPIQGPD